MMPLNRDMNTLRDLTPETVDELFNIDTAVPTAAPCIICMIGIPGVGKTSGHTELYKAGIIAPHTYATINLDTLLESLKVFRAASSMAYALKQEHSELVKFGTIQAYTGHTDDLGLFKWYNTSHNAIAGTNKSGKNAIAKFDKIRAKYRDLPPGEFPSITEHSEMAFERAMAKSVNIVYETTLSVQAKDKRVPKIDRIMELITRFPQYRLIIFHVKGAIGDVAERISSRQEYITPYLKQPFYRHMTTREDVLAKIDKGNYDAVTQLRAQYPGQIVFMDYETVMNRGRLAPPRSFETRKYVRRIKNIYGNNYNSGYNANSNNSRRRSRSGSNNR